MNKSTIYKFKEDVERIEIPHSELDAVINNTIRSSRKSRKVLYSSLAAAAMLLVLVLGSGFVSPVMANVLSKIPFISSVLPFTDAGLESADERGLVKSIGETVKDEGIEITVTDLYYDDSRLEIGYTIPLKEIKEEDLRQYQLLGIAKADLFVNGNEAGYSATSSYKNDYISGTIAIDKKDFKNAPEKVDIKLKIKEVLNKQGNWTFALTAEKADQAKILSPDQEATSGPYTFKINKLKLTPSSTNLHYVFSIPSVKKEFNEQALTFKLTTDKGKEVPFIKPDMIFIEEKEGRKQFTSQVFFEPIDEDVAFLTVTPYIRNAEGEEKKINGLELNVPVTE